MSYHPIGRTSIGGITVSTVRGGIVRYPETALFLPNGDSDVIATYESVAEARAGHRAVVAALTATKRWMASTV